jgi:hypothetical protein
MPAACRRRNSDQLVSSRLGAGSIPASRTIVQTVLAAILMPSPTSSPSMRRYPQPGFSRASRTQAHGSRTVSRAGRAVETDTSNGSPRAPDASAEASPVSRGMQPTRAVEERD